MFPLNTSSQSFNINTLTVVNYGLKIPIGSFGSYSSLNSASNTIKKYFFRLLFISRIVTNEANQQTSVCRVDISPIRGSDVPCSNDISSVFTFNSNGFSAIATTNLGMICNVACKTSKIFFYE
jgi:hypothetical protein